jgi:glucan biosynthesis protein C
MLKDPKSTNITFDLIVAFVHAFRMPVFFIAAGYFGSLLFYKKGSKSMILNRINRILLPFLAAVLLIFPMVYFVFVYTFTAFKGEANPLFEAYMSIVSLKFIPFQTAHLWFLYYLIFFSFASWVLASILNKQNDFIDSFNKHAKNVLSNSSVRLIAITLIMFLCHYWMGTNYILTKDTFEVVPSIFVTYFVFYALGWLVCKFDILDQLIEYPWLQLVSANLFFLITILTPWPAADWVLLVQQILASIYTALYIFGFIAFFLKYFDHYSRNISYLMEASYWVYIIHLPIVAFIPGLLIDFPASAFVKFAIVFFSTTIICFVSYHYLVRSTWLGKFINGKVHK